METLKDYNETLQRQAEMEMALEILSKNFTTREPRRFISGIALSSNERNANDEAFEAKGGIALRLPLPLLWNHEWHRPIGKATSLRVRGSQLLFDGELCNTGLSFADDVWRALVQQFAHGVSVGSCNQQSAVGHAGYYASWVLREISIAPAGADPGARVLKCWERAAVVYANRSRETIHWDETE